MQSQEFNAVNNKDCTLLLLVSGQLPSNNENTISRNIPLPSTIQLTYRSPTWLEARFMWTTKQINNPPENNIDLGSK